MQQMPMNRHLAKPLQSLSEVPNEALWCYAYIMEASQDSYVRSYSGIAARSGGHSPEDALINATAEAAPTCHWPPSP
jgi:hypothetical protein